MKQREEYIQQHMRVSQDVTTVSVQQHMRVSQDITTVSVQQHMRVSQDVVTVSMQELHILDVISTWYFVPWLTGLYL